MSYSGRVRLKASCRVANGGVPAIVAGTNSGLFLEPLVDTAQGVVTINLDPDNPNGLAAQDTVIVTVEAVTAALAVVQRVSATQIVVRTFSDAGAAVDAPFSIDIYGAFLG